MKLKKLIVVGDSNENLSRYFTEIRQYEGLSKEEETKLIKDFQKTGSPSSQDKIIKANLKFVVTMAKQYQGQGATLQDLIAEGHLGILEALKRFDTNSGFKFFSYAVWWIRLAMFKSLYNDARTIKLPDNRALMVTRIKREVQILEQRLQCYPSLDELYDFLKSEYPKDKGLKNITKDVLYEAIMLSGKQKSIQDKVSNDEDCETLEDIIKGDVDLEVDEDQSEESLQTDLAMFYFQLNQTEYDCLILSLGLNGEPARNSRDLAFLLTSALFSSHKSEDIARLARAKEKDVTRLKGKAMKRLRKLRGIDLLKTYL